MTGSLVSVVAYYIAISQHCSSTLPLAKHHGSVRKRLSADAAKSGRVVKLKAKLPPKLCELDVSQVLSEEVSWIV